MAFSNRRQEIYDRIRETSKTEYILEEMIRLGFWPGDGSAPFDPQEEIQRKKDIRLELSSLRSEETRLKDTEAMLRQVKRERMQESRRRQKETKERRERERIERAEGWQRKLAEEIGYLGEGVSGGLNAQDGNDPRLQELGLPQLQSAKPIAEALGVSVRTLRFLSFNREVSTTSNYVCFEIPKRTGGTRRISAPMPTLKYAQDWVLRNILERLPVHDAAQGFCTGRSIVTNAKPHLGAAVVVNIDLKDFFPSVSYKRVKGLFRSFGYSEAASTILGLLCTEPDCEEVEMDGKTYYVASGTRCLPQGAPSSPAITNLICRRLDDKLSKLCTKLGFTYTRYADDMTFSTSERDPKRIGKLLYQVRFLVKREGFAINEKKTRVLHKANRQEVTGIVVNERMSVSRKRLKAFRATLYQIEKDGPEGKTWGTSGHVLSSIWGFASFVAMVDPEKGIPLQMRVWQILEKHGWQKPQFASSRTPRQLPAAVPGHAAERAAEQVAAQQNKATPPPIPSSQKTAEPPPIPTSQPPQQQEAEPKPWWKLW